MALKRKTEQPYIEEAVDASPAPGTPWTGRVCFYEGFHYPVHLDGEAESGPDLSMPLIWNGTAETYAVAAPSDPSHFHVYGNKPVDLEVGGE